MRIQTKQKWTNFAQNDQTLKIYKEKKRSGAAAADLRERWKINCRWQRWKWVNNRHITTKTIEKDNLQSNKASIFIVKSGISLQDSFSLSSRSFSYFRLFHVTNFQIGHNFTVVSVTTGLVWFGFRFSFGFKFTIALPTSGKKKERDVGMDGFCNRSSACNKTNIG